MELRVKEFLKLSFILFCFVVAIFCLLTYFLLVISTKYYLHAVIFTSIISSVTLLFIVLFTLIIIKSYKVKYIAPYYQHIVKTFMSVMYPILDGIAGLIKINKQHLKLFYIDINNIIVSSKSYKFNPIDVLLLTPHCLQYSECNIKITNNPNNCINCGKCNIKDLVELSKKYGVMFYVATGGTSARKVVLETKPKYIISVACERDLLSGIQDIKNIPVMGIVNNRENGPCFNTSVDTDKVETAIRRVI